MLRLNEIRLERKLNITQLAELTGVSRTYISEVISGKYMPTIDVCCKICKGLKITPNDLVKEEYYR